MSSFMRTDSPARQNIYTGISKPIDAIDCHTTKVPVVQVKSIQDTHTSGICMTVQCCYCFQDHEHIGLGNGNTKLGIQAEVGNESIEFAVPDCLGHHTSGCHDAVGSSNGYIISTCAWKLSGRSIVQAKIKGADGKSQIPTLVILKNNFIEKSTETGTSLDGSKLAFDSPYQEKSTSACSMEDVIHFSSAQELKHPKLQQGSEKKSEHHSQLESQFDKLLSVSKLFIDRRLVQVLESERKLKLSLYWKDHNCIKLGEAMAFANQKFDGPNCNCISCSLSGRRNEGNGNSTNAFECTFNPYFQALLLECNIICRTNEGGDGVEHESTKDSIFEDLIPTYVYDIDAHLISMGGTGWYIFTYGSRLWKERSIESVELKNFSMLFQKLYYDGLELEDESEGSFNTDA